MTISHFGAKLKVLFFCIVDFFILEKLQIFKVASSYLAKILWRKIFDENVEEKSGEKQIEIYQFWIIR